MTVFERSLAYWVGGAVVGAALAKGHRVAGAVLGAIVVGSVSDIIIERDETIDILMKQIEQLELAGK